MVIDSLEWQLATAEQSNVTSSQSNISWNNGKLNWENASKFCDTLILGDRNDWRLPQVTELSSLFICRYPCSDNYTRPYILEEFSKTTFSDMYWSSSPQGGEFQFAHYGNCNSYWHGPTFEKYVNKFKLCLRIIF